MSALITLMFLVYNLTLIAGATYLIVVHNWSGWTYVLAVLFSYTSWRTK